MRKIFLFLPLMFLLFSIAYAENEFLEGSVRFDEETEEIYLENPMSFKYDTGYREVEKMSAKDELSKTKEKSPSTIFKKNNLSFESTYKKGKSDFLTECIENKQMIKYDRGKLVLSAGINNSYEYTDLNKNTRKLFFSPQFRINEHVTLGLNNALNANSRTFEQGVSLRYKPFFIKNTSFGFDGSIKQKENNMFTRKFEFNSEFYLW